MQKKHELEIRMYRKKDKRQSEFEEFLLPFWGNLSSENRWVKKLQ